MAEHEGTIEVLGIAHYRVEFASVVRSTIARLRPAAIAVELPSTLESAVRRAVRRLPELSVVLYVTRAGEAVYLPVEPTDPIIEAIRSGLERDIPVSFVDLDVDDYPDYRERLPDPWAMTRLGPAAYAEAYRAQPRPRSPLDRRREAGMAWRSRALARGRSGPVLLVCGLAHVDGVARALAEGACAEPLSRVRREGVSVWNLDPRSLPELLGEMPYMAAVYECLRQGPPPAAPSEPAPRPWRQVGPFRVLDGSAGLEGEDATESVALAARRLAADLPGAAVFDRMQASAALFDAAAERYVALSGERILPWQRRSFARFARRLAASTGMLVPDLHDLLVAARGTVDDAFAFELWRLGSAYPWQREVSDVPTARLSGPDLRLGTRRIRLRRRLARPGRHGAPRALRRRRAERWPGEWLQGFRGEGICSYPPEDLVVESFGARLKRRGAALLRQERARIEPFSCSIQDGIDVRETLRRWHSGEIWVREEGRYPGDVGNVVVIFDEDPDDVRYPFLLTWLGEHAQESDMAFYATDPREGVVGPGICRATYGGFLLSTPPRRMADVWSDQRYAVARSKPDRLVLAALDYSVEPLVVLVAARPPSSRMKRWASQLDRRLVYLPLGQVPPATRKRLRVLHVLDGYDRREIARDYIW